MLYVVGVAAAPELVERIRQIAHTHHGDVTLDALRVYHSGRHGVCPYLRWSMRRGTSVATRGLCMRIVERAVRSRGATCMFVRNLCGGHSGPTSCDRRSVKETRGGGGYSAGGAGGGDVTAYSVAGCA